MGPPSGRRSTGYGSDCSPRNLLSDGLWILGKPKSKHYADSTQCFYCLQPGLLRLLSATVMMHEGNSAMQEKHSGWWDISLTEVPKQANHAIVSEQEEERTCWIQERWWVVVNHGRTTKKWPAKIGIEINKSDDRLQYQFKVQPIDIALPKHLDPPLVYKISRERNPKKERKF